MSDHYNKTVMAIINMLPESILNLLVKIVKQLFIELGSLCPLNHTQKRPLSNKAQCYFRQK